MKGIALLLQDAQLVCAAGSLVLPLDIPTRMYCDTHVEFSQSPPQKVFDLQAEATNQNVHLY
jgi:hypothetical protein